MILFLAECPVESVDEGISIETEKQIIKDYGNFMISLGYRGYDIWVYKYFGTYNGYVVVDMSCSGQELAYPPPGEVITAPLPLNYKIMELFTVWKNGVFYMVYEAHNLGLLGMEDLKGIAYWYK